MKKTLTRRITRQGYIDGNVVDWLKLIESFAGREVVITVETAEKEKSKVQVCQAFFEHGNNCDKPAQWELWNEHTGAYSYCTEHVWRGFNPDEDTDYTVTPITPISPEPPKPVVVEWEEDHRYFAYSVVTVPRELRNKCFKVRFEEKQPPEDNRCIN